MAVTLTTLESNLQTKLNATSGTTDAQEFLLLSKSVEALTPSIAVQSVIDEGTTQVGLVQTQGTTQVGLVQTEGATQVAAVQAAAGNQLTQADIDTSISALVDSAPATLDTLNELAAALGDDANFSTTVTNSIATKLPLAGGTMTGDLSLTSSDSNRAINITSTSGIASIEIGGTTNAFIDIKVPDTEDFDTRYANNSLNCTGDYVFQRAGSTKLAINATGAAVTGDLSVSGSVSGSYTNLHPEVTTANVSSSQTIDMTKPMHHFDMTAATAFSGVSIAAGRTSMMVLDTTATPHTPTWGNDIKWPGATEPTWADSRYWIVSMTCLDGSIILASASGYTV